MAKTSHSHGYSVRNIRAALPLIEYTKYKGSTAMNIVNTKYKGTTARHRAKEI